MAPRTEERTEEEFTEELEDEFAPEEETEPEPPASPDEEGVEPPEPGDEEPAEAPPDSSGDYSREEMDAALRTLKWAQSHPERWEKILRWEQQGYVDYTPPPSEPAGERTREPETEDLSDDEFLDDNTKQLMERVQQLESVVESERRQEAEKAFEGGLEGFRSRYDSLDENQFQDVLQTASDFRLVERFADKYGRSPEAVDKALEAAYKMTFFDEAKRQTEQEAREEVAAEARKRRRASAVGQGSRSASRAPAEPKTRDEKLQAMASELEEAME